MTAQTNDIFVYDGAQWELAGISEGELFDPADLGAEQEAESSACWRGYKATFAVVDSRLVLHEFEGSLAPPGPGRLALLHLKHWAVRWPRLVARWPGMRIAAGDMACCLYEGLDYPLPYTGGVLLAHGFIPELYVHMGFHPAWKYREVIELVFERGRLVREIDRSERMAEIRVRHAEWQKKLEERAGELEAQREQGERGPVSLTTEQGVELLRDMVQGSIERAFDRSYRL
jgi:hypothetical protein